ncbi:hypothetical protein [Rodentibacter pneumotropicus]|uniref:hypothetical protein n=1 Tax=Rodentibacter pneumotropicus TaxID=758 RepID=UPI000381E6A8|nr:hypothetical protein [Rodentibacter pneumotropicus]
MRLTESGKQQAEPIYQATVILFERVFNAFGQQKTAQLFALMGEFNRIWRTEIEK